MSSIRCYFILLSVILSSFDIVKSQFYIKSLPASIKFNDKPIDYADIYQVFHHILGFSKFSNNIKKTKLFSRPTCIVAFTFESQSSDIILNYQEKLPLTQSDVMPSSLNLKSSLDNVFGVDKSLMIETGHGVALSDLINKFSFLFDNFPSSKEEILKKVSGLEVDKVLVANKEAQSFVAELRTLLHITEQLGSNNLVKDKIPDFFNFNIQSFDYLIESDNVKKILNAYLSKMTSNIQKAYQNNCAVFITNLNDIIFHRQARNLLDVTTPAPTSAPLNINLAPSYDENYPAFFNIILWFVVALVLTLWAISYGIWNMDPGKDSIIYRMTAPRLKKD